MSTVKEKIKSLVGQNAVPELESNEISSDSTFVDIGYDSLQFIKLIVDIEGDLEITIEDEMLDANFFKNYGTFEEVILSSIRVMGEV